MEGKNNRLEDIFAYILFALFAVGAAGHLINIFKDLMLKLTPFVLLFSSLLLLFGLFRNYQRQNVLWLVLIFFFTLIVEIIGVRTGSVFGEYHYGEVLGINLFEVPIIIGINWVMILAGSIATAEYFGTSRYYKPLVSGSLALLFDFALEPVAMKLEYWHWAGNEIPIQNYAAWFLIAAASGFLYNALNARIKNILFIKYYVIQLLFFLFLNIFL